MVAKKAGAVASLLSLSMVVSACSGAGSEKEETTSAKEKEVSKEPVELVWYWASVWTSTDEIMIDMYLQWVTKKYPHISFKFIQNRDDSAVDKLVATETKVDLIFGSATVLNSVKQYELIGGDMTDLVKTHKFDLNRIEDSYLDLFRDMNDGKLAGIPLYDLRRVTFYNKDLFDKFGVAYPKDGMTWEETYELSKRMTRRDNGVQYRGYIFAPYSITPTNQYSTPFIDSKAVTAKLQTDPWKKYIDLYAPLYQIPGFNMTKALLGNTTNMENLFIKDQTAAMLTKFNSDARAISESIPNWDAVTFPELSEMRGYGSQPYPVYLAMSSTINPNHRDAAFQMMEALSSDESQKHRAMAGSSTTLKSPEVKAVYGQKLDIWEGKNFKAVTAQKPAKAVPYHKYNSIAQASVARALMSVAVGENDVNTALRIEEEVANKSIETDKAAEMAKK